MYNQLHFICEKSKAWKSYLFKYVQLASNEARTEIHVFYFLVSNTFPYNNVSLKMPIIMQIPKPHTLLLET